MFQDGSTKELKEDLNYQPPKTSREVPSHLPREEPIHSPPSLPIRKEPTALTREPLHSVVQPSCGAEISSPSTQDASTSVSPTPPRGNPTRASRDNPIDKLSPDHSSRQSYTSKMARLLPLSLLASVVSAHTGLTLPSALLLRAQSFGFDPITGIQEDFHPGLLQSPFAFKAKASRDPDLPTLAESISGPYAEQFWTAMDTEISSLEGKGTWTVVDRSSLPPNTRTIPGTWAQRIKRMPSGELAKFKSRWCCRGDLQKADYEGSNYSPLVGWPTVRTALTLAAAHGWKSRQVDFTFAFCQSPQPADKPL